LPDPAISRDYFYSLDSAVEYSNRDTTEVISV
jgi:hypothetical protein